MVSQSESCREGSDGVRKELYPGLGVQGDWRQTQSPVHCCCPCHAVKSACSVCLHHMCEPQQSAVTGRVCWSRARREELGGHADHLSSLLPATTLWRPFPCHPIEHSRIVRHVLCAGHGGETCCVSQAVGIVADLGSMLQHSSQRIWHARLRSRNT